MQCQIKWVMPPTWDPTPDTNEATCMAVKHTDNRMSSLKGQQQEVKKFHCCAEHEKKLDSLVRSGPDDYYYKGKLVSSSVWTKEPILVQDVS